MDDKFELGKCNLCGEYKSLKNGKCLTCNKDKGFDFGDMFGKDFNKLLKREK